MDGLLNALSEYGESNLFLRGLIPTMGFSSDIVYFDVKERAAGQSKYTLKKMLTLAMDGITSMSVRPLRIITALGVLTLLADVLLVFTLIDYSRGNAVQGYTTTLLVLLAIGGVIMLSSAASSLRDNIAMVIGMCFFVGLNYLGQKFFVFRKKEDNVAQEAKCPATTMENDTIVRE